MKSKKKVYMRIVAILTVMLVSIIGFNIIKNNRGEAEPEVLISRNYDQVQNGDEAVDGTDYVTFDAFYLRDLDGDGYAEKLRGTCREIGTQDTLYMDLNVLTNGTLKDAKITINGKNFYFATALVKDSVISKDYIGTNTKEIVLNDVKNGTQKLIFGMVQSGDYTSNSKKAVAIGNDTNKYSVSDNTVTLTGTHVADDGTETPISKTITLTNDWHGTTRTSLNSLYRNQEYDILTSIDEENEKFKMNFKINAQELDEKLILSKSHIEGELPLLAGYAPDKVTISASNANFNYNENTRKFTIDMESTINENGNIVSKLSRNILLEVNAEYPIEAYRNLGENQVAVNVPIKAWYEGYNNSNKEFSNPYRSNVAEDIVNILYRPPLGDATASYVVVGKAVWNDYANSNRYVISKELPLNIYNNVDSKERDKYLVKWEVYSGSLGANDGLVLSEKEEIYTDRFLDTDGNFVSMEKYVNNIGIYFSKPDNMLGKDGYIKVYNDQTNELIHTFTSEDWNVYSEKNPFMYPTGVKHIRIETSEVHEKLSFKAYNIKEIDDVLLTTDYDRNSFEKLRSIYSTLSAKISKNGELEKIGDEVNFASYEEPYSLARISLNQDYIANNETQKGIKINVNTVTNLYNTKKWKDGEFLIKYPSEIIDVNINSVTTNDPNIEIIGVETYEQEGSIYTKIYTYNENERQIDFTINADITADPRIATTTKNLEMYYYNPVANNYNDVSRKEDVYDINGNQNISENVGYSTCKINIIAPSNLITSQTGTEYDNKGSVVVAPQVAFVQKSETEKTATINVNLANNYSETISGIRVVGKIPFEGNKYQLNGEDLGSTFDTAMSNEGINIPEELLSYATIYYSYNENVTDDINDKSNGWTTTPENMSQVKCYMIDLGEYIMPKGATHTFKYTVKIPGGLEYNSVSYSNHAIYYYLDTDQGKLRTQTEPNKLGFMIADKFDLEITKYETNSNKVLSGVTFVAEEVGSTASIMATTYSPGIALLNDLYVEREYVIKEIKTNANHVLNTSGIKIIGHMIDGKLQIEILEGSFREAVIIETSENENIKAKVSLENEVKYNFELSKTQTETNEAIEGIRFELADYTGNKKSYTTNAEGKLLLKSLEPHKQYTLEEVDSKGHYLKDPVSFMMTRDENGNLKFNVLSGELDTLPIIDYSGEVPVVRTGLANEKIPTYSLKVKKTEKDTDKVLKGTQFKITGEGKDGVVYTTDENGYLTIDNLYEYIEGKNVTGEYTLQEVYPAEGYILLEEPIVFKAQRNATGSLELQIISGEIKETPEEIIVDNTDENNPVINITIENEPIFTLTKVDAETGEPLEGVEFQITDMDGNPVVDANGNAVDKVYTDSDGKIRLSLVEGLYKAIETKTLEGYILPELYTGIGIGQSQPGKISARVAWENNLKEFCEYDVATKVSDGIIAAGQKGEVAKIGFDGKAIWVNKEHHTNYNAIIGVEDGAIVAGYEGKVRRYSADGKELWQTIYNPNYTYYGMINVGDGIITATSTGQILKYSLDGEVLWESSERTYEWEELEVLNDGFIAVSNTGQIVKYDFNGKIIWENLDYSDDWQDISLVDDGILIISANGVVLKINFDGSMQWKNSDKTYNYKAFTTIEDGIIAVDGDGRVAKYDYNGTFIDRYYVGYAGWSDIVALDNEVLIVERWGSIAKFTSNLTKVWQNIDKTYMLSSVVKVDDGVIVIEESGGILKYDFDGNILWEKNESWYHYTHMTLVEDGFIAVSYEGYVVKYDFDGKRQWEILYESYDYRNILAVNDGIIAIGHDGNLVKFKFDGTLEWDKLNTGYAYRDMAKMSDGIVTVTESGQLVKYDFDGNLIWENTEKAYDYNAVMVVDDGIMAGDSEGRLVKYSLDGKFLWRNKDHRYEYSYADIMKDGDYIILTTWSGAILKYDFEGNQIWENAELEKNYRSGVVVDNGYITVGNGGVTKYEEYVSDPEIPASQNVIVKNERLKFNITTEVDGGNGIILGEGENPYETVSYGNDSTKDIIATPDAGYKVESITVNGEKVSYIANDDGTVELNKFVNMTSDKHVVVKFSNTVSDIIVHHYIKDTTTSVADDEVYYGNIGEEYITSPKMDLKNYELVKKEDGSYLIPDNASGTFAEETQVITYYYELKPCELIVHHYLDGTEDSVAPDETQQGLEGETYTTSPATPPALDEKYELVENKLPENATGVFTDTLTEVTYYYKVKEYNITTEVEGGNGKISGESKTPYEIVQHGKNSVKDIIVTPDVGYKIKDIIVNGTEITFTPNEDDTYTLDKFTNMTEDKHIIVTFERKDSNAIITKIDKDTKLPLEGVEFKITDENGYIVRDIFGNEMMNLVTDENGNIKVNLPDGKYNAVETKTLRGYVLDTTPRSFEVKTVTKKVPEVLWRKYVEAFAGSVATNDGIVTFSQFGDIVKYDENGNEIWTNSAPYAGTCQKIVKTSSNNMIATAIGYIIKISNEDGSNDFDEYMILSNIYDITAIGEEVIIAENDGSISRFALDGSKEAGWLWTNTDKNYPYTAICTVDDGVIAASSNGQVVKYSLDGKKILWENTDKNYKYTDIYTLSDGVVAVSSEGQIVKYDLNGNFVWENTELTHNYMTVNAMSDGIIAAGYDDKVAKYSFDGKLIWQMNAIGGDMILGKNYSSVSILNDQIYVSTNENSGNLLKINETNKISQEESTTNITIENEYKEYNITTEVDGIGGTISGENENPYEVVLHKEDSVKDIVCTPDKDYKITSITINGTEIEFTPNADGTYTLPKFTNMTEDKHIIVKYEKKDTSIIVKHVTEDGTDIIPPETIPGKIGDPYITEPKDFAEYELKTIPDNATGDMTEEQITVIYVYSLVTGKVTITKVDNKDNTKLLSGATFKLEKLDASGNVDTSFTAIEKTTDETGRIEFTDLLVGKYQITETQAPEGYQLAINPTEVEINKTQREINITAKNRLKLELPETGSINYMIAISVIGIVVMATSVIALKLKKKN